MKKSNTILFVGGGSGGPVAPLLAVMKEIKDRKLGYHFVFIGGKFGPERQMVENEKLEFFSITAGKWRRYFSVLNFFTPFLVTVGFIQSLQIVKRVRPVVAVGAGSFLQVPALYAAWLFGSKILIHQQDMHPSLANTLCSPIAKKITVCFENSAKSFFQGSGLLSTHKTNKVVVTGNPFRQELKAASKSEAMKFFNLKTDWPTVLVLGGGTGAKFINDLVVENMEALTKLGQIIHVSGAGKRLAEKTENYRPYEFISRMDLAYAAADIVLCRAGLSTITELSNLGKISIVIPMPDSHQEENAAYLWYTKAAIVLDQKRIEPSKVVALIKNLLFKHDMQKALIANVKKVMPHNAGQKIADLIIELSK
jgi:UDP-N-acetylglucosamine--N-acetylmuramyl-(pentapeptide) pyrophosphoryl-undecaprenol N-acetylglucosamine transferase